MKYFNAWASMRLLLVDQGFSWSGREKDHLFLNLGDSSFTDLSALSGADNIGDGRGLALIDWDDDGQLDVFLKSRTEPRVCFYRNQMASTGHFVTLDLRGVRCNRDAIGARVELQIAGKTRLKTLRAGEGYLAQSSKRLHFGLGAATRIERLRVLWPDGSHDEFADLAVDARYEITQGARELRVLAPRLAPALASTQPVLSVPSGKRNARVPLVEKLPLAALAIPGFEKPGRKVGDLAGGPVLLNFWSTTCASCLVEFGEWHERRELLELAGLRIVPMCTDTAAGHATALEILQQRGLSADGGLADASLVADLTVLLEEVLGEQKVMPLPTSLLLDERGQLVVLYLGGIEFERLLRDVRTLTKIDPAQQSNARLLGGVRMLPRGRDFAALAEKFRLLDRPELAGFYSGMAGRGR